MLENEKQRLIEEIHAKERTIQKTASKVDKYTTLKDQETNPLKKWYDQMMINHYNNNIHDQNAELEKLIINLQVTLDVIASRQRDFDIIEQKKHFLLPTTLPDPNPALQEEVIEQDWISSLSNAISSFITKTSENINKASAHVKHSKNDSNKKETPDFKS